MIHVCGYLETVGSVAEVLHEYGENPQEEPRVEVNQR